MKRDTFIRRQIVSAGLAILGLGHTGGGHIKATVVRPSDGVKASFIFANTPGEYRGDKNKLAELRRFGRGTFNPFRSNPTV